MHATGALPQFIPSPPINGFNIGPLDIHFYALGYIVGIIAAVWLTRRRWAAMGGNPDIVLDLALWVVPAGIIGGRIYFDITTPQDIPDVWYGPLAVWTGGLGIWGGVLLAALVGVWRLKRWGITAGPFANAIAPGLLVAQGIGRIGNYFNKELFGSPTTLPWGLEIPGGPGSPVNYRPPGYTQFATFQPTFLYELIWDFALAGLLIWIGHRFAIKRWSLFALYVAGYSAFRIFEESVRIDSSQYILGLRLNFFVALFGTVAGLVWFVIAQRLPERKPITVRSPEDEAEDKPEGQMAGEEPVSAEESESARELSSSASSASSASSLSDSSSSSASDAEEKQGDEAGTKARSE